MFYNIDYLIFMMPALLICMAAQMHIQSTFSRYSRVHGARGLTGAQAARRILDHSGLGFVQVEQVAGTLSDHYDPRTKVVRLSSATYGQTSVAALGVAAHEVGHAIQHAAGYAPLNLRNAIIPVTRIGSQLSVPLILLGLILALPGLVSVGIAAFSLLVLFQLITLPVEYNASRRAIAHLESMDILYGEELIGAKKVLSAAALTYVAALLQSLTQLIYYTSRFGGRRRR